MPDDHEERAAMLEALRTYKNDNRPAGYGPCFEAAWQARRAYERERFERLRAADRKRLDTLAAIARAIGADANTLESALRRFVLASVPGATGEGAEEQG